LDFSGVVSGTQPETSFIILSRREHRNRAELRIAQKEQKNWKMEIRKWKRKQ